MDHAVDEREIAGILGQTWFGSGLSLHARTRLAECARWDAVPAGTTILHEGDETSLFAVVVRGRVALRLHVPERGPVTILTVEAGDVVGWSALVPPHRATSTAVALEASDLVVFHPRRLRAILDADLALAATLYPRLMEALGRRLGATRQQLLDLYTQQAEPVPW